MALLGLRRGRCPRWLRVLAPLSRTRSRYWSLNCFSGGSANKWEPPPPPTLQPGVRPKCVVLHCTPPRASRDGRQLEEVSH
jgi:hypothetical protein